MGGYGTDWLWELVDRGPGWDGHDAVAITADVVNNVEKYLAVCPHKPDIIPYDDNSISLEWGRNEDKYLKVVIHRTYYKAVLVYQKPKKSRACKFGSIDGLLEDREGILGMIEEVIK